jgi:aryl-alcohol dehydrogenase-like predicted oxidoreductase
MGSTPEWLGTGLDEAGAHAVLDRGVAVGAVAFDTAYSYALGAAQRMIGSWLAADSTRRSRVALLDKVGVVVRNGGVALDLRPETVRAHAAAGRERMGVAAVDVVMFHAPDDEVRVKKSAAAFAELIADGSAYGWGLSNVTHDQLRAWLDAADALGMPSPRCVENRFNLLERGDESTVLPLCREHGVEYLAYSPLAGGVLTGKYRPGEPPPAGSRRALRPEMAGPVDEHSQAVVDLLTAAAEERNLTTAALCLAWVLAQPGVRPIVGASRASHVDVVAEALAVNLSDDEIRTIGRV